MPLKITKTMGMYEITCTPDDDYVYYYSAAPDGGAMFLRVRNNRVNFFSPSTKGWTEDYNWNEINLTDKRVYKIQEKTSVTLPAKEDWLAFPYN